jgi:single-strand DNA-binding protein
MSPAIMPSLNKVIIVGVLTRDPELRYTTMNIPVANFKIASGRKGHNGNRDDVCHIGVVAWQKLAESCVEHLRKGQAVLIEGELKSRIKNESNGSRRSFVEIRAQRIQSLSRMESLSGTEESNEIGEEFIAAGHSTDTTGIESNNAEVASYNYDDNTL